METRLKGDEAIVLPTSLFSFKILSAIILLFTLLNTSFEVAEVIGKHCYVLSFIKNNRHYRLTK